MQTKLLEIRDRATFIKAFAARPLPQNEEQRFLLRSAGYSCSPNQPIVIFGYLQGRVCFYDPYSWGDSRTMKTAHEYVAQHFDELKDGDVIDVEYILKETDRPKISERLDPFKGENDNG